MKHQKRPCLILKILFLSSFLMMVVCMVTLWTPVLAGERCEPVDLRSAIRQVANQNMPAVVHIEATRREEMTNSFLPFENNQLFEYFFNVPRTPDEYKKELKDSGTGFLINSDDHILTSNSLAQRSTTFQVLLADGRQYPAELVGADPRTDLAVIRIWVNEPLPHVTFGDSDEVEVGDWVVAIGCSHDLAKIVTQGIISAKHRAGGKDLHGWIFCRPMLPSTLETSEDRC